MAFRQRIFWLLVSAVFCWAAATLWKGSAERQNQRFSRLAEDAQVFISEAIREQNKALDSIEPFLKQDHPNLRVLNATIGAFNQEGLLFYVFEGNAPLFWSSNQILPDPHRIRIAKNGSMFFTGNGWYYLSFREYQNKLVASLLLIRHQYPFQNSYLTNHFNRGMNLPESARLFTRPLAGTWAVTNAMNHYLFSLGFSNAPNEFTHPTVALLYGLAFLFLFLLLGDVMISLAKRHHYGGFVILFFFLALRLWLNYFHNPNALFESEAFSPRFYASGFLLNSPGDMFLTVATVTMAILFFYYWIIYTSLQSIGVPRDRSLIWSVMVAGMFLSTFLFSVFINYLLSGLVLNSQISFNVSNVFELNVYSLAGISVFGVLLFALYMLCDAAVRFIRRTGFSIAYAGILFLVSQGIFLVILLAFRDNDLFQDYGVGAFLLTNTLVLLISYIRITEKKLFSFSRSVLALVVFSLYAAQLIYHYNRIREHDKRQLLAAKLENEQDLVAEFLMEGITSRIVNDSVLTYHLTHGTTVLLSSPQANDEMDKRLMRLYFGGYLNRYEIRFRYFDKEERPINISGDPTWNLDLIRKNILQHGTRVGITPFYYIPQDNGRIYYNGLIQVKYATRNLGYLAIEMSARYMQDESASPAVLLTNRPGLQQELSNYSFARYQGRKLLAQSGPFNYYMTPQPYGPYYKGLNGMRFADFDNYSHLFYRFADDGLIVISLQKQGAWVFLTLFSYIFTFFTFSFVVVYVFFRMTRDNFSNGFTFKTRIQLTVVLIVIATLFLTGAATVAYIIDNSKKVQQQRIREKVNNILLLVENLLSGREELADPVGDDLVYALSELSNTLGTDFNLYNLKGKLLYTTQSRIYDQELLAPLMSRTALTRLTTHQKAIFTETEKIGNLSYLAGYEHIRNNANKTVGYLSLPYFAKESELKRDVSTFLIALINIYILLFSLAILAAFLISNRVTKPLLMIQESLRKIKPGKPSDEILWQDNDEIGALINEYNSALRKLQESAELLARSERESAWREMARQVAHEIKNPLTPMKLGVQHLLRAYEDNHPEKEELLKRIGDTLIEQIDTLSNIATEFSNFAVMPRPAYTSVDLVAILKHTVDLYNESGNAGIELTAPTGPLMVMADKDQLVRIFTNLVKNALQSIPDERKGLVVLQVMDEHDYFRVSVQDNGSGIPKELIDKIFTPNFTTKSGGTGLGLAMVKNMVNMMNGEIWFTTVENKGTSFFVRLPRV
jgi:two-component system, NtrC family, nitrogen regulation sensor histidine kinase NtrY